MFSVRNIITRRFVAIARQSTKFASPRWLGKNEVNLIRLTSALSRTIRQFSVEVDSADKVYRAITSPAPLSEQSELLQSAFAEKNDEMIADALSSLQNWISANSSAEIDLILYKQIFVTIDNMLTSSVSERNQLQALNVISSMCFMKDRSVADKTAISNMITKSSLVSTLVDRLNSDESPTLSRNITQSLFVINRVLYLSSDIKAAFQAAKLGPVLVTLINAHLDNSDFLSTCLMAARSLCFLNAEAKSSLIEAGLAKPIIRLAHENNDDKLTDALLSTQSILSFNCEAALEAFSSRAYLTDLMRMIKANAMNGDVIASGLSCLRNLTYSSVTNQEIIMHEDVVDENLTTLLSLAVNHPNSFEVLSNLCPVILTLMNDEVYRRQWDRYSVSTSLVTIVATAFNSIKDKPATAWPPLAVSTLTSSFKCFKQILFKNDESRLVIHSGVKTVLTYIMASIDAPTIPHSSPSSYYSSLLSSCIYLVTSIQFNQVEYRNEYKALLSNAQLTRMLTKMPESYQITEAIAGLIGSFGFNDPEYAASLSKLLPALLLNGKTLQSSPTVANHVLRAASILSYQSPAVCECMSSNDALVSLMIKSLSSHPNERIYKSCLMIMRNYRSCENYSLKESLSTEAAKSVLRRASKSANVVLTSLCEDMLKVLEGDGGRSNYEDNETRDLRRQGQNSLNRKRF